MASHYPQIKFKFPALKALHTLAPTPDYHHSRLVPWPIMCPLFSHTQCFLFCLQAMLSHALTFVHAAPFAWNILSICMCGMIKWITDSLWSPNDYSLMFLLNISFSLLCSYLSLFTAVDVCFEQHLLICLKRLYILKQGRHNVLRGNQRAKLSKMTTLIFYTGLLF